MRAKHNRKETAIVHIADILARGMGYGEPGDPVMPPLDHDAWMGLGLSYQSIDRILAEAETDFVAGVDLYAQSEASGGA